MIKVNSKEDCMRNIVWKDVFNVPNLITYFRILCIPIFVSLMLTGYMWSAILVFAVAAISDLFDGVIARKYNLITNIGISLDPLADKLMHVSVLISLSIIGNVAWVITVLILLKEIIMIIVTAILNKHKIFVPANIFGKISSAVISVAIILAFFHNAFKPVDTIALVIGVVLMYFALFKYSIIWKREWSEHIDNRDQEDIAITIKDEQIDNNTKEN